MGLSRYSTLDTESGKKVEELIYSGCGEYLNEPGEEGKTNNRLWRSLDEQRAEIIML